MICQRCGYCCYNYDVIIVKDPKKGIREDNLIHKESGKRCPHLRGSSPGKYRCAIHNKSWYKKMPCYSHGQIEQSSKTPCRMGVYVLQKFHR